MVCSGRDVLGDGRSATLKFFMSSYVKKCNDYVTFLRHWVDTQKNYVKEVLLLYVIFLCNELVT